MKRAALYMQVSTLDRHPEAQLYDLHEVAKQRGYQIVEEYTDRISGAKARWPGLDELMHDARRGRFEVVLVWASDRIARSVRHFLEVRDELNRLNVEFISFREQIDTGGPLGRAVLVIIGPSLNSSAASSSSACGQAWPAPSSRVARSDVSRLSSIRRPSTATAARARAFLRSHAVTASQRPP